MTIETKYFNSGILINKLLRISSSLSGETDLAQILENILDAAMEITGADEGRIYQVTSENLLITEIVHTKSKENSLAGNVRDRISDRSIPLFTDTVNCCQFRSNTKESFSIVNHCSNMG